MKIKSLEGKFIRQNRYGVAKIWFVRNIYKNDYQLIIDYMQITPTQSGSDKLFSSSYEMSYVEFQRQGIAEKFTENRFDMDFSQEESMRDFIRTLMHT